MIGTEVTVTLVGVLGNQVRIGIKAPKDVEVYREEVYEKVQAQKAAQITYEVIAEPGV